MVCLYSKDLKIVHTAVDKTRDSQILEPRTISSEVILIQILSQIGEISNWSNILIYSTNRDIIYAEHAANDNPVCIVAQSVSSKIFQSEKEQ